MRFIIFDYFIKRLPNSLLNPIEKDLTRKIIIVIGSSDEIGIRNFKKIDLFHQIYCLYIFTFFPFIELFITLFIIPNKKALHLTLL